MKKKTLAQILIFIIAGLLFVFSIELPVIGFKKLEYIKESSTYRIISYNWYGKEINEQPFKGDPSEMLDIVQKQDRLQKLQGSIVVFALLTLAAWIFKEKKVYLYGSALTFFILIFIDVTLVHMYN
ncbi:hypothetical protein GLW00_06930 [Halobacillus litoralis]|uniref:DUF4306 domain-containing protein n=1 Tax=Halobacillus litoralis TaxID=45668 RepID=A0A845FAA1_9BACI|nr:hypothetical protein [Halobacillus litoralis]MYL70575.1 hypothetical protein [Halobacillus litoralis]